MELAVEGHRPQVLLRRGGSPTSFFAVGDDEAAKIGECEARDEVLLRDWLGPFGRLVSGIGGGRPTRVCLRDEHKGRDGV
jgi:hypothetical protein